MSSARPTKEGNLRKYRNFLLGWSRSRYFKLERSYLHYFEAPYAPEPIGSITRGDIADVKESNQFEGKNNVFELHTKSGVVWFLQADTAEEMVSWMRVLVPTKELSSQNQVTRGSGVVSDNSLQPNYNTQYPGGQPQWQGQQGPYNTSPMQPSQMGTQFDPRMFAAGGPMYDPRVPGQVPCTPPPPYTEESQPAQPLPIMKAEEHLGEFENRSVQTRDILECLDLLKNYPKRAEVFLSVLKHKRNISRWHRWYQEWKKVAPFSV